MVCCLIEIFRFGILLTSNFCDKLFGWFELIQESLIWWITVRDKLIVNVQLNGSTTHQTATPTPEDNQDDYNVVAQHASSHCRSKQKQFFMPIVQLKSYQKHLKRELGKFPGNEGRRWCWCRRKNWKRLLQDKVYNTLALLAYLRLCDQLECLGYTIHPPLHLLQSRCLLPHMS